jgi:hypothetical protein
VKDYVDQFDRLLGVNTGVHKKKLNPPPILPVSGAELIANAEKLNVLLPGLGGTEYLQDVTEGELIHARDELRQLVTLFAALTKYDALLNSRRLPFGSLLNQLLNTREPVEQATLILIWHSAPPEWKEKLHELVSAVRNVMASQIPWEADTSEEITIHKPRCVT